MDENNNTNTNGENEIKELEERLRHLKSEKENNVSPTNIYLVPAAIVIAGIIIGGAVVMSQKGPAGGDSNVVVAPPPAQQAPSADAVRPVTDKDHIKGDINAPVKIVEFSDLECPFCKRIHPTLKRAVDEYGGQVAWIYRHFPLDSIHSKARFEAAATECANELGGNTAFWSYIDRLFEITPSNNGLDLALLPQIAEYVGLDRADFEACLGTDQRGGKYAQHIEEDVQDATASGGRGTPYNVVIAPNGKTFPVSGAVPYASIKSVIDLALTETQ